VSDSSHLSPNSANTRRRTRQSPSMVKHRSQRASKEVVNSPPPVMVRKPYPSGETPAKKKLNKTRRRFDIKLDGRGSELRLPTVPMFRVGWRIASLLMLAFLGYVLSYLWNSPSYQVDAAQVDGLKRLTSKEVNQLLNLTGEKVFFLDEEKIHQELMDMFPEFQDIKIHLGLPNSVSITVTERVPVLIWQQPGRADFVDGNGLAFPIRNSSSIEGLPIVVANGNPPLVLENGMHTTDALVANVSSNTDGGNVDMLRSPDETSRAELFMSPELVSGILLISQQIPNNAQLIYDPDHGFGWKDKRGWDVYIGKFQEINKKLLVYRAILENLKSKDTRPTMISVEYAYAPYYRLVP